MIKPSVKGQGSTLNGPLSGNPEMQSLNTPQSNIMPNNMIGIN